MVDARIEAPPLPRQPDPEGIGAATHPLAMELRLSDRGRLVRESIAAHAEAIALTAMLTRDEAEPAKSSCGAREVCTPSSTEELVYATAPLRGARRQLADALQVRVQVYHDLVRSRPTVSRKLPRTCTLLPSDKGGRPLRRRWPPWINRSGRTLRPQQLRAMATLLNKPVAGYEPTKAKAESKGAP